VDLDQHGHEERKKATFRKTFTISEPMKSAQLNFTCDNGATAYLNGVQVAKNSDWNGTHISAS
jgi:hypothetical protein